MKLGHDYFLLGLDHFLLFDFWFIPVLLNTIGVISPKLTLAWSRKRSNSTHTHTHTAVYIKIHSLLKWEDFTVSFPINHVLTCSAWPNWEPNWSRSSSPIKPSESLSHTSNTSSSFPTNERRLAGSVRKPSPITTPCCRVFRLALWLLSVAPCCSETIRVCDVWEGGACCLDAAAWWLVWRQSLRRNVADRQDRKLESWLVR